MNVQVPNKKYSNHAILDINDIKKKGTCLFKTQKYYGTKMCDESEIHLIWTLSPLEFSTYGKLVLIIN